jgi:hypothetical protein
MKKTLITLLIFSLCSLLTAQFVVWHNGEIIFQTDINNVDSITLYQLDSPGEEDNPPIDRAIAVQNYPQFILDSYVQCRCVRPMPVYSVPGLIDHF